MPPKLPLLTALLLALASTAACAGANWFTVAGDPRDTDANTVQVDPVAHDKEPRRMRIRVSRSGPRISWDGVPYRSYVADVLFDCAGANARYLGIHYHLLPLWQDTEPRMVDYANGPPRMMEFREITPNPTTRIIAAACGNRPRPAATP